MNNNHTDFAANEISKVTETTGLSAGYLSLMIEAQTMNKPDLAALTQNLVKSGVLPELSFAFLDQDRRPLPLHC